MVPLFLIASRERALAVAVAEDEFLVVEDFEVEHPAAKTINKRLTIAKKRFTISFSASKITLLLSKYGTLLLESSCINDD